MGKILSREVVHLDRILWNPNWEMLPFDERKKIHDGLIREESWIIDGMWRSHLADRYPRATLVVFLDFPRRTCLFRAVRRRVRYAGKQRDDIANGCLEKLDGYFLKYIFNFRRDVRPFILRLAWENAPGVVTLTLCSPKQAENFLKELSASNKRGE